MDVVDTEGQVEGDAEEAGAQFVHSFGYSIR